MELFSTRFKELVNSYLASPNHFIGTITSVYDDEFIRQIKGNPDIEVITITLENRAEVYEQIYSKLTGV
ncbi:MAG: NTPase [bacterium ADurb.Bin400]|nr:MAG: NTPase [bacterium ADurb.Bin400]